MKQVLTVSSSPHIREGLETKDVMYAVVIALAPAAAGAVYFFGMRALVIMVAACLSAAATEALLEKAFRRKVTIADGSALITGLLLAFNLPPGVPYWMPVVGSAFAIAIVKLPFGGLGYNPFNPALAARTFLLVSWPVYMTSGWLAPARGSISGINAITTATPLGVFRLSRHVLSDPSSTAQSVSRATGYLNELYSTASLKNLFLGNHGGCLGETSVLLLAIGAAYLLARRVISWRIPLSYLGTVAVITWIAGGSGSFRGQPLFHLMSGGLMLGAFFMATDIVTSPVTPLGRLLFGAGCGVLTGLIRLKGGYPEGVSYAILIMNVTVPLIDRFTKPRKFGQARRAG